MILGVVVLVLLGVVAPAAVIWLGLRGQAAALEAERAERHRIITDMVQEVQRAELRGKDTV